jgi:secreted PhoX family phosphatase
MTELDRRSFLKTSAAVAAGTAVAGGPFAGYLAGPAVAGAGRDSQNVLRDVPDQLDGVVRLALPDGFQYRSFQRSRRPSTPPAAPAPPNVVLDDGSFLPGRHDGMAAFAGPGPDLVTLVRNHEENGSAIGGSFGAAGTPTYDTSALGGTSTVHVTPHGEVQFSYASLSGTQMNCSGGQMPWGSWVTCEETVNGYDIFDDFTRPGNPANENTYIQNARLQKTHGFIFEVPVAGDATAEPITHAGRFPHESVAWERRSGALYLSEDNFAFPSGFYKYVPPENPERAGRLLDGGKLYMLKVAGVHNADLAVHIENGTTFDVDWVEIEEPFRDFGRPAPGGVPTVTNNEALRFVSNQGLAQGAAMFSRLEGTVEDRGWIYFTSTQAGVATNPTQIDPVFGFGKGFGQIWAYDTREEKLHMLFESPSQAVLDFPDNVTTSPRGTLVVCEDGNNPPGRNFLRGLTRNGELFDIAENRINLSDEFAGSTFSPDGGTLFVNIQQTTGMSFAIWGPWGRIDV